MNEATQVLVVGAGPVGLTAAHELARRGIAVRLVDAAPGPATTSRAIATHARTLELYDQLGVLDEILAAGLTLDTFTLHSAGREMARLGSAYRPNPTRFPFSVGIDQVSTERVLREAVARLGVPVEWGTRLESLVSHPDRVEVTLTHQDGTVEHDTVDWLVGCDGGHSTVRKQLGLPLLGDSTETWLLADAVVDTDLPRNSLHLIRVGAGNVMMVPLPGDRRWRVIDTVDVEYDGNPDRLVARLSTKLTAGLGRPTTMHTPTWISVFTAQQRMIPTMHHHHTYLAGDAAHVHSPASGQGMNTGIQEAHNLAWKLAMVIHHHAHPTLLDTYSTERVPIGAALLGSTRKATHLVALKNRLAGVFMPVAFAVIRNLTPLRRRIAETILGGLSGLRIAYRESPLTVGSGGPAPRPGERVTQADGERAASPAWDELRAELRDPRWTLLTTDPVAIADERWLNVRTVTAEGAAGRNPLPDPDGRLAAALHLGDHGWILVRPDGYVAARGTHLTPDALATATRPIHLTTPIDQRPPEPADAAVAA